MQGSKYAPSSSSEYSSKDLNASYKGQLFTALKNSNTNLDFKVLDDCLVDGGRIITAPNTAVMGDYVSCFVVDVDNVLGYGAGLVLNQFVDKWYLMPGKDLQWDFSVPYPAKVYAGLYIRVMYHSAGTEVDIPVAINYKLHKILW